MTVTSEKLISNGVIQDNDGNMALHIHPVDQTLDWILDDGITPCRWCARGVPLRGPVKRIVVDGVATFVDAETGAPVA